jgi:DNA modification methylase
MRAMSDKSVAMVLTDIPYNEVTRKSNGLRNLNKGIADVLTFDLNAFLVEINRVCHGSFYIFCGQLQVSSIMRFFRDAKLSTRLGIWEKTNPSPMNGTKIWLSAFECCVYAKHAGATFTEHCKRPIWKYPVSKNKHHPTEKPLGLFERLILASSLPGDIIFDPCVGAGTTAIAAIQAGRNFVCVDNCQTYVDITNTRVAALMNQ